ncbi:MAG TPA: hypothetical protein VMP10_00585 [Chloroflexota bacterium]|nr:hypothetical protein [Chloroflexota bacterium]
MQYDLTNQQDTRVKDRSASAPDWYTLLPLAFIVVVLFLSPFFYDLLESLV